LFAAGGLPRRFVPRGLASAFAIVCLFGEAFGQGVESRRWQGATAVTNQAEHVVATTGPEWLRLWRRTGIAPPERFVPERMSAVGIFLGRQTSEGCSVNILSASRRRDRIVVVFEERRPIDAMTAQQIGPGPGLRPLSNVPPPGAAPGFAPPGTMPNGVPHPNQPIGQPSSPWAIVLIDRADLPITVVQRLFR
jgi:hypothetical protein